MKGFLPYRKVEKAPLPVALLFARENPGPPAGPMVLYYIAS